MNRHGVGHTCITWDEQDVETAVAVLAELGYEGVEVFGWTLEELERQGKLELFGTCGIPLTSVYFAMNLCDPNQWEASMARGKKWADIMKRLNARYICLGGEDVDRRTYRYEAYRKQIQKAVNEYGKRFADMGLTLCYHPHTGTPIQTEEEIRSLMEGTNPDWVSFAPDVGQIQKAGANPVSLVGDYLERIRHIHLKDYDGKPLSYDENGKEIDTSGFVGYTPLGEGVVELPAILDLIEHSDVFDNLIMVELDGGKTTPIPQREAVLRNREYLRSLGYHFRTEGSRDKGEMNDGI